MAQLDEEFSRRAEELKKTATELTKEFRKIASDFRDQTEVFTDDLRKRARGASPFERSAIEKIRDLAVLRDDGIITDEEFQQQKIRLLDQV